MALLPDQPVMISGSTAFDPGARSATAQREHEFSEQNAQIADKLRQVADILAAQKADPFRIAAYHRAAESIRVLNDDLGAIAEKGGRDALEAVPFIDVMGAYTHSRLRQSFLGGVTRHLLAHTPVPLLMSH
jgi:Helix-hairpin-helix domain